MYGLMVDGLVDGGLDEWIDGGLGRWMDGWMDACMDRWLTHYQVQVVWSNH